MKDKFIQKAIIKYGDLYNYTKVDYINSKTKIEIICKEHGSFFVRPDAHLTKVGCPKCNGGIKYDTNTFIEKADLKFGNKFDYTKVDYINSKTKVEIVCNEHGSFFILPANHLAGQQCSSCSGVYRKNTDDFNKQAVNIYGNKYDYSRVNYINNRTKIEIICLKHGSFEQIPKDHLNGHGCAKCCESKGEEIVSKFLDGLDIEYIREHCFDDCRGIKRKLPFDFFLKEFNLCIEFDGRQHFQIVEQFGGESEFLKLVKNDEIKTNYCFIKGINLIRIKYDDVETGINLLKTFLIY